MLDGYLFYSARNWENIFYYSNHHNFMRLLRFARNDTPFCHCEESALVDDEAIYFFAELTQ